MKPTVLVTGASSGIGEAIALEFAKKDCNLVIASRSNTSGLARVRDTIQTLGCDCLAIQGDVSDPEFCQTLCQHAVSRFGAVDCLINNAGISHIGLFQDMTPDQWDRLLKVNLYSVIQMSHAVLPSMLRRHSGSILNISSVWGTVGASCEVVYSASKGAVNSFTKALAKELAPSGIRVNAIACGAIDTTMNAWLDAQEHQQLLDEIPAGRMGRSDEAAMLAYQLFEGPQYLTGQVITLDGGWT
ncbi:MAG: SDR family NAD(P)-dependent oxidoreductase [Lachnospiraceae bacterium]|nr:SDR family NAD(P)-dependent oxidoreductase [Lachnospiraceae bacterium]